MKASDVLHRVSELIAGEIPHALVTVVRAMPPTSAYVGAQAIVYPDGSLEGWVGGGCAQDVLIGAAQAAILSGEPKLIRISNDRLLGNDDLEQHPMACASNGTIELFIQPANSGRALCVLGQTPAAEEARFLAGRLGIRLVSDPAAAPIVLVATQGDGDEAALETALLGKARHILMIASPRKATRLKELMRGRGIPEIALARLQAPAGPDVGAKTPAEIALVALTAVLSLLRRRALLPTVAEPPAARAEQTEAESHRFVNPVCGRVIDTAAPKHVEEFAGTSFYFCCDGCWQTFRGNPSKYASIHQSSI